VGTDANDRNRLGPRSLQTASVRGAYHDWHDTCNKLVQLRNATQSLPPRQIPALGCRPLTAPLGAPSNIFTEMSRSIPARSAGRPARGRRIATLGLVALVFAVAGCGSGSGSGSSSTSTDSTVDLHGASMTAVAAHYLGIPASQVRSELESGRTLAELASSTHGHSAKGLAEAILAARRERLETYVKAGKITQAQLETRLTAVTRRIQLRLVHMHASVAGVALHAAAQYLHITPAKLHAERQQGRSYAEIADSTPGHSAKGLETAIVAAAQARAGGTGAGAPSKQTVERAVHSLVHRTPAKHGAKAHHNHGGEGESEHEGESESE